MVLGAGRFQLPLIRAAQGRGLRVIAVSRPGPYPGLAEADVAVKLDVRDRDGILRAARTWQIDGVVTDQTDLPVRTAAHVAEQLGLPGIGTEVAHLVTDKLASRRHCERIGVSVPAFVAAPTPDSARSWAAANGYPVIVKPADSQGSRGVRLVSAEDDLAAAWRSARQHSAAGSVLVEQFVRGTLVWCVGLVDETGYTHLLLGDSGNFDLPGRFIHRHSIHPAGLAPALRDRVIDLNRRLFESLGAPFGIAFSQCCVAQDSGEVWLIEGALRGPAGYASSHFIPLATGVDVYPWLLSRALGEPTDHPLAAGCPQDRAVGNVYFEVPTGVVRRVSGLDEIRAHANVELVDLGSLVPGLEVAPMRDATGAFGPVVVSASSRSDCARAIEEIAPLLRVEIA